MYLSLTVDPARDTVSQIKAYRALFSPVPSNWIMATGSATDIAAVRTNLRVCIKNVPQGTPPPVGISCHPVSVERSHAHFWRV